MIAALLRSFVCFVLLPSLATAREDAVAKPAQTRVRIIDAVSGVDLDPVHVETFRPSSVFGRMYIGDPPVASRVANADGDSAPPFASPIVITQGVDGSRLQDMEVVLVRSPGYADERTRIHHDRAGEQVVRLYRPVRVTIELDGWSPLRETEDPDEREIIDEARAASRPIVIFHSPPDPDDRDPKRPGQYETRVADFQRLLDVDTIARPAEIAEDRFDAYRDALRRDAFMRMDSQPPDYHAVAVDDSGHATYPAMAARRWIVSVQMRGKAPHEVLDDFRMRTIWKMVPGTVLAAGVVDFSEPVPHTIRLRVPPLRVTGRRSTIRAIDAVDGRSLDVGDLAAMIVPIGAQIHGYAFEARRERLFPGVPGQTSWPFSCDAEFAHVSVIRAHEPTAILASRIVDLDGNPGDVDLRIRRK